MKAVSSFVFTPSLRRRTLFSVISQPRALQTYSGEQLNRILFSPPGTVFKAITRCCKRREEYHKCDTFEEKSWTLSSVVFTQEGVAREEKSWGLACDSAHDFVLEVPGEPRLFVLLLPS